MGSLGRKNRLCSGACKSGHGMTNLGELQVNIQLDVCGGLITEEETIRVSTTLDWPKMSMSAVEVQL